MIETNQIIIEFLAKNAIALGMLLMFLRGMAKTTSWTWDEKIVELLVNMVTFARRENKPTN